MDRLLTAVSKQPLWRAVKPIHFLTDEDLPPSLGSTLWMCTYHDRVFGITAAHSLEPFKGYEMTHLRVSLDSDPRAFIPWCGVRVVRSSGSADELWQDFAIYETPLEQYTTDQRADLTTIDLGAQCGRPRDLTGFLTVLGYPSKLGDVDLAPDGYSGRISTQGLLSLAELESDVASDHCLRVSVPRSEPAKGPTGLSGSPLLHWRNAESRVVCDVVGMVISAGVRDHDWLLTCVDIRQIMTELETIVGHSR